MNFISRILEILKLDLSNLLDIRNKTRKYEYNIKDFLLLSDKEICKFNNNMKFDIVIANPPFNLDTKMLIKYFEIGNIICTVLPSAWLLGKKLNKNITKYFDQYGGIIEPIDGSEYFDAAIGGTMSINYCDTIHNCHYVKYGNKNYTQCKDITFYSNDTVLSSILNKIDCKNLDDSFQDHIYKIKGTLGFNNVKIDENQDSEQYVMRTMAFSGQSRARSKLIGEFYSLISNTIPYNKVCGKFKDLDKIYNISPITKKKKKFLEYYFKFNNEQELKFFWNYIHTDFVRICLYFIKTNLHIDAGELRYIPWFNFSDKIFDNEPGKIDYYLFKKYKLTKEEILHIYDILPNYYNILRINLDKY